MRAAIIVLSLVSAVCGLLSPLFQKEFIDRLMGVDAVLANGRLSSWSPELLILGAFAAMLLASGFGIASVWIGMCEAMRVQAELGNRMYRKTLRMRPDQLGRRTVGEVVSIYATDVPGSTAVLEQTLPMGAGIVFPLVFAPLAVHWIARVPLWATMLLIGSIVCLNAVLSYRQSRFFFRFKQLAAERTGLVAEWVQNIRLLRILGWVGAFEGKIHDKRVEETANRVAMVTNGQMMGSIGSSISFFVNFSGVASLVYLRGGDVSPGELLALLWIFGVFLARPFRQIPWLFTFLLDGLTSLRRVEAFLADRDEGESRSELRLPAAPQKKPPSSGPAPNPEPGAVSLDVRGLRLEIGDKALLTGIDLSVAAGEFVALVGEVGSGKSLLLMSLMGETGAEFEEFKIDGVSMRGLAPGERRRSFGYVPQEGFVMSAVLRENVALQYGVGPEVDAGVAASLSRAQFRVEKESAVGGLEADIGERGVNMSGGQRQRVSLARADFIARPVLLLDDCLSAVDVATERKLIDDLISGAWAGRTRILATHRLTVLEHVDRVLFMKEGRLAAEGSFAELLDGNEAFRRFAATVAIAESASRLIPMPPEAVVGQVVEQVGERVEEQGGPRADT